MSKLYRIDCEDIPTTLDMIDLPYPIAESDKERASTLEAGDEMVIRWVAEGYVVWLQCCGTAQEYKVVQTLTEYGLENAIAFSAAGAVVKALQAEKLVAAKSDAAADVGSLLCGFCPHNISHHVTSLSCDICQQVCCER